MIQRRQTIYLLISVVLFALTFAFPFGKIGDVSLMNYAAVDAAGIKAAGISHYYFSVILSIAAIITFISIFLYADRFRQMTVLRLSFICYATAFALLALYIRSASSVLPQAGFDFGISFFLPFGSFILNMLALRCIRRDEQLVRSLDRLR